MKSVSRTSRPVLALATVAFSISFVLATTLWALTPASPTAAPTPAASVSATPSAESFPAVVDTYFVQLSAELAKIAENPALKKNRAAGIDPLFLRELKRNMVINALVRTDAKGQLTTEFVRMKEPNHGKVSYKKQKWYSEIAKGAPEYFGMDSDTARYYLVWSKPIVSGVKSTTAPIAGVVMMKIDLWDCFCKLARNVETPFLVRLNKISLYSNKWQNAKAYDEFPLNVPGARAIALRMEKPAPVAAPAAVAPAKPDSAKINNVLSKADSNYAAQKKSAEKTRAKKLGLIAAIAAFILLLVLVISFISWIRHKMLVRSINKGL
jgi:hypothetical protein